MREFWWHVKELQFWGTLDYVAHKLPLPKRLQHWLCEKYDATLMPKAGK